MISKTEELIKNLANTKTEETLFNPYNQVCRYYDINTAPGLRQGNLRLYLECLLLLKSDTLYLSSFAEYQSTKMSGVPLLEPGDFKAAEERIDSEINFEYPVKRFRMDKSDSEDEAVWLKTYRKNKKTIFWHLLPFYPHDIEDASAERRPTDDEFVKYAQFTHAVIDIFQPKQIITNDKETMRLCSLMQIKATYKKS